MFSLVRGVCGAQCELPVQSGTSAPTALDNKLQNIKLELFATFAKLLFLYPQKKAKKLCLKYKLQN